MATAILGRLTQQSAIDDLPAFPYMKSALDAQTSAASTEEPPAVTTATRR